MAQRQAGGFNLFQIFSVIAVVTSLVGLVVAVSSVQQPTNIGSGASGNGAPNGAHYNLNVIGVSNTTNFNGGISGGGNVIFVPLNGGCKINLAQGSFSVVDGNCVNDGSATFQLPSPDPTNSGTTTYSVWVRALGKPGGKSSLNTCATDPLTSDTYCSIYTSVSIRDKGKSTFTNVSKELLYIYYYDLNGHLVRVPLFDSSLENYYWQYNNQGLKLLQMRFYAVPTTVPTVPLTPTPLP